MSREPVDQEETVTPYAYVVLRVRRFDRGADVGLVGVAERLGTGEKRSFATGEELLRLIALWSAAPPAI